MSTFPALASAALAVVALGGCFDTHATDEHGQSHDDHAASTYEEGRGLQLTEAAAKFAGIEIADHIGELPPHAVLRTVRGDFVFVQNDGWFRRIPADHLRKGDRIVVSGIRTLRLVELQAINGGAHTH